MRKFHYDHKNNSEFLLYRDIILIHGIIIAVT